MNLGRTTPPAELLLLNLWPSGSQRCPCPVNRLNWVFTVQAALSSGPWKEIAHVPVHVLLRHTTRWQQQPGLPRAAAKAAGSAGWCVAHKVRALELQLLLHTGLLLASLPVWAPRPQEGCSHYLDTGRADPRPGPRRGANQQ